MRIKFLMAVIFIIVVGSTYNAWVGDYSRATFELLLAYILQQEFLK